VNSYLEYLKRFIGMPYVEQLKSKGRKRTVTAAQQKRDKIKRKNKKGK